MPRTKTFDPEWALTKAMEVFRARGYGSTHMGKIAEHIGVSRSSLYATFGDKRALFLSGLRRDAQAYRTEGMPDLGTSAAPRKAIIDLFESTFADGGGTTPPGGILLIRTALELVPNDPEVSAVVQDEVAVLEQNIRRGIERAQTVGEIDSDVDAAQAAWALLGLFLGTHLLLQSRPLLHAAARQVEALLPPPQVRRCRSPGPTSRSPPELSSE